MRARLKSIASSVLSLALLSAFIMGLGAGDLIAQRFEHTYGDPLYSEAGRGGVRPVRDGGYVAVGESFSRTEGTTSDIYLVRTDNDGSLAWSLVYDIGGNDSATDIEEILEDPDGNGGFIITGVTENLDPSACRKSRDLFLLRVDRCGNVSWVMTYGTEFTDEIGWDVIETRTGNPFIGTNRGDFVVAGSTTFRSGCGRNGYLLRVTAGGGLIWDAVYDGPGGGNDYFYALDECLANQNDITADIVVVGGTNSYSGNYDAWIVRVDGDNGGFTSNLHAAAAYGREGFEELRSVQELRFGCNRVGNIVATGSTSSGLPSSDVYIIQTTQHPCEFVDDRTLGDADAHPDEGYSIREIPFNSGEMRAGDIVVTGYLTTSRDLGGHGGKDVFLQTYLSDLTSLLPRTIVYGGSRTDWGWSVAPVAPDDCRTAGLVVAGFTGSPDFIDPYDPQQLYFLKTDASRDDRCTALRYPAREGSPRFEPRCQLPNISKIGRQCKTGAERYCQYWWQQICLDMDNVPFCPVGTCECGG